MRGGEREEKSWGRLFILPHSNVMHNSTSVDVKIIFAQRKDSFFSYFVTGEGRELTKPCDLEEWMTSLSLPSLYTRPLSLSLSQGIFLQCGFFGVYFNFSTVFSFLNVHRSLGRAFRRPLALISASFSTFFPLFQHLDRPGSSIVDPCLPID